jgi:hypothetical protein
MSGPEEGVWKVLFLMFLEGFVDLFFWGGVLDGSWTFLGFLSWFLEGLFLNFVAYGIGFEGFST